MSGTEIKKDDIYFLQSLLDSFDADSTISSFLCVMRKDPRYNTVNKLITSSQLNSFSEMLGIVPKTVLARDLGMHHITFNKLINNPGGFTLDNIYEIASLVGVENKLMLQLFYNETGNKKAKRKKYSNN